MNDTKYQVTGPTITEEEAKLLFVYHLQQAACMFEVLPDGYQLPIGRFDDFTKKAAGEFLASMEEAYGTPSETDGECD